jgi:mycothiol synthase
VSALQISSATDRDLDAALELFHRGQIDRILETRKSIDSGSISIENIIVARESYIVGVAICTILPGASAMLWPPVVANRRVDIEDALIAFAIEKSQSAKFLHTFTLSQEADAVAPALTRGGFRYITRVWEMCRLPESINVSSNQITLMPYRSVDASTFQHIVMKAHDDAMDCPELQGLRTPEEVMQGYRAVSPNLDMWFLALEEGLPIGVLLMSDNNIAFLGLIPEARGRGLGRQILQLAIDKVNDRLNLIVDARNYRAYRLYRSEGFYVTDSFEFFLHELK